MLNKIKAYTLKQIKDVKNSPKILIKKWWFWIIVISVIYGISTDLTNNNEVITNNSNALNTISTEEKQETEEERLAREEKEKKEAEEKQKEKEEKERQQNIEDTKWTLYATTEQIVKNRLKAPSTAKFLNQAAVYDEATQTYKVQGDVDSQNSFGATIRSTFYAEYNNKLEIIYMTFDGEVWVNNK